MAQTGALTARSIIFSLSSLLVVGLAVVFFLKEKTSEDMGPFSFFESEIKYQMELNKIIIPQATDRNFAIGQLFELKAYESIMAKNDFSIEQNELYEEQKRIEKNSRLPELLRQIKKIPDQGSNYYLNIFVRDTLIRRLIHSEFYFSAKKLHRDTWQLASQFFIENIEKNQAGIAKQAGNLEYEVFEFSINPDDGIKIKHQPKKDQGKGMLVDAKTDAIHVAPPSEVDAWFSQHQGFESKTGGVLDEGEKWTIYFFEQYKPDLKQASGLFVVLKKVPFQDWISKELSRIKSEK